MISYHAFTMYWSYKDMESIDMRKALTHMGYHESTKICIWMEWPLYRGHFFEETMLEHKLSSYQEMPNSLLQVDLKRMIVISLSINLSYKGREGVIIDKRNFSFIQHRSQEATFEKLIGHRIKVASRNPNLVYSWSFKMSRQETYTLDHV